MITTIALTTDCEKYSIETSFTEENVESLTFYVFSEYDEDDAMTWEDGFWIYYKLYPFVSGECLDDPELYPEIPQKDHQAVAEMLAEADNMGIFDEIKNSPNYMKISLN